MPDPEEYHYPHSVQSLPVLERGGATSPEKTVDAAPKPEIAPAATTTAGPSNFISQKLLEGKVIEALHEIYDPEIPVNIYELGLIYEIKVDSDNKVHIKMTLTAPACPVAGSLPGEVEKKVEAIPEVTSADVERNTVDRSGNSAFCVKVRAQVTNREKWCHSRTAARKRRGLLRRGC